VPDILVFGAGAAVDEHRLRLDAQQRKGIGRLQVFHAGQINTVVQRSSWQSFTAYSRAAVAMMSIQV
jgi:hypothetical protein